MNKEKDNKPSIIDTLNDFRVYSIRGIRITLPLLLITAMFIGGIPQESEVFLKGIKALQFIDNLNTTFCMIYLFSTLYVIGSKK